MDLFFNYKAKGIIPSPAQFKEKLLEVIEDRKDEQDGLIDFIESFISEREAMKRPKGTIKVYKTCLNKIKEYGKVKRTVLNFEDINERFKNDFIAYLYLK